MDTGRRPRGTLEQEVVAALAAAAGPMTPAQVRDHLGGDLAYTTVMTVLARLSEKGLVTRRRVGRAYAYAAVRDEAEAYGRLLQAAGVPAEVVRFDHLVHSFASYAPLIPAAADALERCISALRKGLLR